MLRSLRRDSSLNRTSYPILAPKRIESNPSERRKPRRLISWALLNCAAYAVVGRLSRAVRTGLETRPTTLAAFAARIARHIRRRGHLTEGPEVIPPVVETLFAFDAGGLFFTFGTKVAVGILAGVAKNQLAFR